MKLGAFLFGKFSRETISNFPIIYYNKEENSIVRKGKAIEKW
jgi:hypothetical protein